MARISTYLNDNSISGEDLLTGSNYIGFNNYSTNTFRIKDLAEYFAGQILIDPSSLSIKTNGGLVYETVNNTNFLAINLGASSITGVLANSNLANSTITINGVNVSLGGSFTIPVGDITSVVAGTYLSGGGTEDDVTLNHDDTTRTNATSTASPTYGASFTAIDTLTTNTTGHVTAVNTKTITLPASDNTDNFANSVAVSGTTTKTITIGRTGSLADLTGTFTDNDTIANDGLLDINEGTDISLTIAGGDFTADKSTETDIIINHADVSRTDTTATGSIAHGGNFTSVTSVTNSATGHVTAAETTTYTLPAGPNDATIEINGGTYISGGGDFTTDQSANETLSLSHDDTTRSDATTSSTLNPSSTFDAITTVTSNATGHITSVNTATYTLPVGVSTLQAVDSSSDGIIRLLKTDASTADVKLEAGANITINVDEANDTIEIVANGFGNVYEAATETAHLALTTSQGDIVIRTDENKTYIDNGGTAGTMADYTELQFSGIQNISLTASTGITLSNTSITQASNNLTITNSLATSSARGGIEIGYTTDNSARNYAVALDTEKAYVNVPWANTNTQLTTEQVQDIVGDSNFISGSGATTVTYDDTANTLVISSTDTNTNTQLSTEEVQDIIGNSNFISGTGATTVTYDDTANTLVINSTDTNTNTFRTIKVDTDDDGTANATIGASEELQLIGGANVTLAENAGVVTITASDTDTNTDTKQTTADDATDNNRFIHFVNNAAGAQTAGTNTGLKFNPSTERLTVTNMTVTGTQTVNDVELISTSNGIIFEGATNDNFETTLIATDPTADRTVTIPNATFTIPTQDTTYSAFTGAQALQAGSTGLVPQPAAGDQAKFLKADATWSTVPSNSFRTVKVDTNGNGTANNTLGGAENLTFKKGTNISLSEADGVITISSTDTDTNTTYAAGEGLVVGGTNNTFSLDGSELAADINLNTLITTGWYSQNSNSQATVALNYPSAHAGILEVIQDRGNDKHTVQRYSRYDANQVWHRYRYDSDGTAADGDWSDWINLAADTNTNQLTTFSVLDDDDDDATIAHDKVIKFVSATGEAGTNLEGTGTSEDPFVMTITNPDTVASTVWNLIDGDGTSKPINNGKHVKLVEGTAIDINYTDVSDGTSADPYDITIKHKDVTRTNATVDATDLTAGDTISVVTGVASDARGHTTGVTTTSWNLPAEYSHPTHSGDDISIDTGALTGAHVISDLDFNVTTNTKGHVTDANGTISTRELTPSDIGAAAASHTHAATDVTSGTFGVGRYSQPASGDWWNNGVGIVGTDGVMDVGRYIDFHHADASTLDYSVRLDCESTNVLNVVGGSLEVGGHTVWDENDFSSTDITNWNSAYNNYISAVEFSTANGVLTLTQRDGGTLTKDLDGRYLLDVTDTFTGTLTLTGTLKVNGDIRGNGGPLILNAGESAAYATGQTGEYVYVNAEAGLMVNNSPDNWGSVWAGRKTAILKGDQLTLDGEAMSKTNIQNFKTAYDDKVNSIGFSTSSGVLTLTRQDGGTVTKDLDGRYVLDTGDTVNGTLRVAGSGWLTAEGNVSTNPPNPSGLAFGWNRSGGSAESEIIFRGGTDLDDATLYISAYDGTTYEQYLKIGAAERSIVVTDSKKIQFRNGNSYINSPANTNLDIYSSNKIKLTGATVESHASNDLEFWTNSNKRFEILSDGSAKFYGGLTIEGCLITGDDCPTTFENLIAGDDTINYSSSNKPPAADLNDNGTWDGPQFKFAGGVYIPHRIYHFQSSEFTNSAGNLASTPYDLSYRIFSHNFFIVPEGKYILLPYKRWGRPTGTVSKYGNYVDNNANTWLTLTGFSQNDGPNFNYASSVPAKNYKMHIEINNYGQGGGSSIPSSSDPVVLDYKFENSNWHVKVSGQHNLSGQSVEFHNFYLDRRSDPETSSTNVPDYNDIPEGMTITIVGGANILGAIGLGFAKIGLAQESGGEAFVSTQIQSAYYEDFMDAGGSMTGSGRATAVTLTYVRQHTWPDSTYKHGGISEDTHLQNVWGWVATSIADTPYNPS